MAFTRALVKPCRRVVLRGQPRPGRRVAIITPGEEAFVTRLEYNPRRFVHRPPRCHSPDTAKVEHSLDRETSQHRHYRPRGPWQDNPRGLPAAAVGHP